MEQYSRLGWVQATLIDNFNHQADEIALRDCSASEHQAYTYGELARQVYRISEHLQPFHGERALLLVPGDTCFVCGFLACILSGVTAVPVNLPGAQRLKRVRQVLEYILADCEPKVILALSSSRNELEKMGWHQNRKVIWLDQMGDQDVCPDLSTFSAAPGPLMLQYSSGSTGRPKAVCNFDENIYHHHCLMEGMHPAIERIHTATWLPFYHDLGLFYGLLYPLLSGGTTSFIRPAQFVKDPLSWLSMVAQYRANVILAPDFAYRLCVDSIPPDIASQLDLSCLEHVVTAAEPIRPATLDAFTDHFLQAGFRPSMWMPGYGMAEATLVVGYKVKGTALVRKKFDVTKLLTGEAMVSVIGRELVSSGNCFGSWTLKIVNPETGIECRQNQIGEVWLTGPCLPQGYWNNPDLTWSVYQARLAQSDDPRHYLRTSDLAFLHEGELFICGRLKDVLTVGSDKHMPNDIELSVETECDAVETGGVCVVQEVAGGPVYLICEVHRHTKPEELHQLARQIHVTVSQQHLLVAAKVILIAKGELKKTSSGKVRRSQMLEDLLRQDLKPLYTHDLNTASSVCLGQPAC